MSTRKHLRRLNYLAKYSKLFADHARLPYSQGMESGTLRKYVMGRPGVREWLTNILTAR